MAKEKNGEINPLRIEEEVNIDDMDSDYKPTSSGKRRKLKDSTTNHHRKTQPTGYIERIIQGEKTKKNESQALVDSFSLQHPDVQEHAISKVRDLLEMLEEAHKIPREEELEKSSLPSSSGPGPLTAALFPLHLFNVPPYIAPEKESSPTRTQKLPLLVEVEKEVHPKEPQFIPPHALLHTITLRTFLSNFYLGNTPIAIRHHTSGDYAIGQGDYTGWLVKYSPEKTFDVFEPIRTVHNSKIFPEGKILRREGDNDGRYLFLSTSDYPPAFDMYRLVAKIKEDRNTIGLLPGIRSLIATSFSNSLEQASIQPGIPHSSQTILL